MPSLKSLNARQKRLFLKAVEPPLALAHLASRLLTLDLLRDHSLPEPGPIRILIVRLDTIGDVLLSEPAIAALRDRYPQARIDLVASRWGHELLAGNPAVDGFVEYEGPWHAAWRGRKVRWGQELRRMLAVLQRLRRTRYDLAVELRGDFRDIVFLALTKAKAKVGNSHRGGGFLLHYDARADLTCHRVDFALAIARVAGAAMPARPPRLYLTEGERRRAEDLLPPDKEYIAVHLGAGFPSKRLPISTFAAVGRRLCEKETHRRLVIVGGTEDRDLADEFAKLSGLPVVDLAGRVSLRETAAVLERCRLFIGNDSAPMHLAAAVGTPVVAVFGPSEPANYRPYGVPHRIVETSLPCRPCDHVHCIQSDYLCMTGISADEIVGAAEELLALAGAMAGRPSGSTQ
ncbi:MAG: glycosyltransferase family 9 protein [Chloroflexi bacterium]|nr:glycosyltransferase family 9 protein [Chloroflexota bacterium]